jgi:hypothetical protein
MSVTRELHTATLIANRVLVCGGRGGNARSCDLYDPSTKVFVRTGDMSTDREGHTATLLPSLNTVLICGGASGTGIQNECETFSPITGSFSTVNRMASPRIYFSATLLLNQNVLVCGGSNGSAYLSSCEEYDVVSGIWSSIGSMIVPRELHTATRMTNQDLVLLCGGDTGSFSWSSCEIFNVAKGLSTLISQAMSAARTMHTATLLNILSTDLILLCGGDFGSPINGGGISFQYSCDMYNSSSGTLAQTFGLKTARAVHTATTLLNGPLMVCGGLQDAVFLNTCEFYDTCEVCAVFFLFAQMLCTGIGFSAVVPPKSCGNVTEQLAATVSSQSGLGEWSVLPSVGFTFSNSFSPNTSFFSANAGSFSVTWSSARCFTTQAVTIIPGPTAKALQGAVTVCGTTGTTYLGVLLSGDALSGNWSAIPLATVTIIFSNPNSAFTGVSWNIVSSSSEPLIVNVSFVPDSACNAPLFISVEISAFCPVALTNAQIVGISVGSALGGLLLIAGATIGTVYLYRWWNGSRVNIQGDGVRMPTNYKF